MECKLKLSGHDFSVLVTDSCKLPTANLSFQPTFF
jgi:hypothetical protein